MKKSSAVVVVGLLLGMPLIWLWWQSARGVHYIAYANPKSTVGRVYVIEAEGGCFSIAVSEQDPFFPTVGLETGQIRYDELDDYAEHFYEPRGWLGVLSGDFGYRGQRASGRSDPYFSSSLLTLPFWMPVLVIGATSAILYTLSTRRDTRGAFLNQ